MTMREQLTRWASVVGGRPCGLDDGEPMIVIEDGVFVKFLDVEIPSNDDGLLPDVDMEPDVHGLGWGVIDIADVRRYSEEYVQLVRGPRLRRISTAIALLGIGKDSLAKQVMNGDFDKALKNDATYDAIHYALLDGYVDKAIETMIGQDGKEP